MEEKATINLTAGRPVDVLVEYTNTSPPDVDEHSEKRNSQPALMRGVVSWSLNAKCSLAYLHGLYSIKCLLIIFRF